MISFACEQCGKSLKVKLELAGKKGKCPHCGGPMLAPLASSSNADGKTLLPPATPSVSDGKTLLPRGPNTHGTSPLSSGVSPELYDFLAPPQAPDELGRLGGYRILKVLGSGGMGVVYQAEDINLKRMAAIKAMLPQLAASPSNRERFLREARIAANLEHDHIVTIHRVDEDRGVPFIAMQLLKGQSLEDRLLKDAVVPVNEILRIGRETAAGLQAAHEKGLIHRDIKPANLWLETPNNRIKILDFGLARTAGKESNLTQQGAIIGTPAYMAPEQASGKSVDARSDLFSLGCVLYRLCTGRPPFRGADSIATLMAVATENPKPPHKLNSRIPVRLSKLVMRLLSKPVADRPRSAAEVIAELQEIERNPNESDNDDTRNDEELEVVAAPVGKSSRAERPRPVAPVVDTAPTGLGSGRVMPWLLVGGGGLLVVILLVVGLIFLLGKGPADTGPDQAGGQPTKPVTINTPTASGVWWGKGSIPFDELKPITAGNEGQVPPELEAVLLDPKVTGPVTNAVFSPSGTVLATGHAESGQPRGPGVVKIWYVPTMKERFTLRGHSAPVHGLAFSPDGKWLAAGSGDARTPSGPGEVRVWNVDTGEQYRQLAGHSGPVHSLAFDKAGKYLASTGTDRSVKVWDVENAREWRNLHGHAGPAEGVTFLPDGTLATGGAEGAIRIWDVDKGVEVKTWRAHSGQINALRLTQSNRLASCGRDRQVRLWNLDPGKTLSANFTFHNDQVFGVAAAASSNIIVSGGGDKSVKVYDDLANNFVKSFRAGDQVLGVDVTADGKLVAAACANGRTYLYRVAPPTGGPVTQGPAGGTGIQPERTFAGLNAPVTAVAFSPDGKSALSGSEDQVVRLWNLDTSEKPIQCKLTRRRFAGAVSLVAFQPGGDRWLAANPGGLYAGDRDAMREQPQFEEFPFATNLLVMSGDGKTVMASCADSNVRLCDVKTGKVQSPMTEKNAGTAVALSADGKRGLTTSSNSVLVWDLAKQQTDRHLSGHPSPVQFLAMSEDGKYGVSSSGDGTVVLWNLDTGSELRTLTQKETRAPAVAISPDGKFAAAACGDYVIRVWEVESGKLACRFEGHTQHVNALAFSPDGKRLLSGGNDATMRLWKLP